MKAVVSTFNQEKALVGAFSVIVQTRRLIVHSTIQHSGKIPLRVSTGRRYPPSSHRRKWSQIFLDVVLNIFAWPAEKKYYFDWHWNLTNWEQGFYFPPETMQ